MEKNRIIIRTKEGYFIKDIFQESTDKKVNIKKLHQLNLNLFKNDDIENGIDSLDEMKTFKNINYKKLGKLEKEKYRTYTIDCSVKGYAEYLCSELVKKPNIEIAYIDGIVNLTAKPNDPFFNKQQSLIKMNCENAWDYTKGSQSTLISVIDTGVNFEHEDLKANLWNLNKKFGSNFSNDTDILDKMNHGTSVAGVIGAIGNNLMGIVGVAYNCKIMVNKAFDEGNLTAFFSDCMAAIENSIDNGAKVINCSFEVTDTLQKVAINEFQNYINSVSDKVVLVFSAGNFGSDIAFTPWGKVPNAIKVGALDMNDKIWDEQNGIYASNFGQDVVFSYGTGLVGINNDLSTSKSPIILPSGTSFAAPHVAGVCGLICSYNSLISPSQVRHIIRNSLDSVPAITSNIGLGRVNAFKALKLTSESFAKMDDGNLII